MVTTDVIQLHDLNQSRCKSCGSENARMSFETERFNYKSETGELVELSARVPVWTCPDCNEQYTGEQAEELRHEAVCRYLGRLTPKELKGIREGLALSQSEWAELTGIGIASVKRWESGFLIQSLAYDRYLRLLRDPRNVAALQRQGAHLHESAEPRFRTALPALAREQAAIFDLRRGRRIAS